MVDGIAATAKNTSNQGKFIHPIDGRATQSLKLVKIGKLFKWLRLVLPCNIGELPRLVELLGLTDFLIQVVLATMELFRSFVDDVL